MCLIVQTGLPATCKVTILCNFQWMKFIKVIWIIEDCKFIWSITVCLFLQDLLQKAAQNSVFQHFTLFFQYAHHDEGKS